MTCDWDPDFLERSPMFAPLARDAGWLRTADWPTLANLQRALAQRHPPLRAESGAQIRFVPQERRPAGFEARYEPRIYLKGEVQVRERSWHDLMNALVWLTFPRAKAALNARHYEALRAQEGAGSPNRGPVQDTMTLFDEGGVIVTARDRALLQLLANFEWKRLFWENRNRVSTDMRFYLFGHAIYEKALHPFTGITARGLLFEVDGGFFAAPLETQLDRVDALAANRIAEPSSLRSPRELAPVPILGVPGWCAENERESYYDNRDYFRSGRKRRSPA